MLVYALVADTPTDAYPSGMLRCDEPERAARATGLVSG
jgi:hypothetical protein